MSNEINQKFYDACQASNLNRATQLLSQGADVNFIGIYSESCLIISRDINIIRLLLSNGANVNYKNNSQESAILIQAFNGHIEIVNLLLSYGANINDTDEYGDTPLMVAIRNGQLEMAKLLLVKPCIDVSIKNKEGKEALTFAKEEDYGELLEFYLNIRR
jgi:serine/threonine-protein phosphatase 6 regulatory ankyrin repeat subunit A